MNASDRNSEESASLFESETLATILESLKSVGIEGQCTDEPEPAARLSGSVDRYQLQNQLGGGAFGVVFRAYDSDLQRDVAIKIPARSRTPSVQARTLWLSEAQSLAALDHEGIVPVYDFGQSDDGLCYLVSKFVDGRSLSDTMELGYLTRQDALRVIVGVAEALHHAHKRGLVHCDVKPDNILLNEDLRPVVVDFGLAVHEDQQRQQAGQVMGTPRYMAPEQIRGEVHRFDGRTDIWSLGVILYELLTGRRPFGGETQVQLFDEILHRDPKPLRMIDDTIPLEVERITLKCLSKAPSDRYGAAADIASELRSYLSSGGHQKVQRGQLLVSAVVLGLLAAGGAGFLLMRTLVTPPNDGATSAGPQTHLADALTVSEPLTGDIDIRIWAPDDERRRGLSLSEPGSLPLREHDQIRIEASVSKPSYVYMVWIGTDGVALPVYPWTPGSWDPRPENEQPTSRISLPPQIDTGWPVEGSVGMETLLMLVRDSPLPHDIHIEQLVSGLPHQSLQDEQAIVWLDGGQVTANLTRAPRFFDPSSIDDPVLITQRLLTERLSPHFSLIQAVSFANRGEQK